MGERQASDYVKLALAGIISIGMIWFLWTQLHWLTSSPLENERLLEPKLGVVDEDSYLYVADRRGNAIVQLDPEQDMTIESTIPLEDGQVGLIREMAVDSEGHLYLIRNQTGSSVSAGRGQELVRFDPEEETWTELYAVSPDDAVRQPVQLSGLHLATDGDVRFTVHTAGGFQTYATDGENGASAAGPSVSTQEIGEWFFVAGSEERGYVGITQESEVLAMTNGEWSRVFPEIDNLSEAPTVMRPVYDAGLHSLSLYDRSRERRVAIRNPDSQASVETILSENDLEAQGFQGRIQDIVATGSASGGASYLLTEDRIAELSPAGQIQQYSEAFPRPSTELFLHYAIWVAAVLTAVLFLYFIRRVYLDIINNKIPIAIKQVALFTPALIAGILVLFYFISDDVVSQIQSESERELQIHVANGQNTISTFNLSGLSNPGQFGDATFRELAESVDQAFAAMANDEENRYAYTLYRRSGNDLRLVMTNDAYSQDIFFSPASEPELFDVTSDAIVKVGGTRDPGVVRMAGTIDNQLGETVGVYEVAKSMDVGHQDGLTLMQENGQIVAIILSALIAFFILVTLLLLRPLRKLRNAVERFAEGDWSSRVAIRSKDEIQDLSDRFNEMAGKISTSVEEVSVMKDAYYRFVPQQFLAFLGKEQLHELALGDQVQKTMHVMLISYSAGQRNRLSDSPSDTFHTINSFFSKTGPVLREYNGLVSHYRGGSILALFPGSATEAVRAAEAMIQKSHELETSDGAPHISLHRGPIMIGIIGEEERLAGTSIGRTVAETEVMEGLAERLGASVLITGDALTEGRLDGDIRFLGRFRLEAEDRTLELYDDFSADNEEVKRLKAKTKELFEEGVRLCQEGRFLDARMAFVQVVRIHPDDLAAKNGFFLADDFYRTGAPSGWNGTFMMHEGAVDERTVLTE